MRRLLIFACAFATAVLLFVYLLPEQVAYGLAIVFALSGFCLALLRRKTLRRLAIAALGLAVDSSGVPFIRWSFISLRWMLQVRVCRSQQQYRTIQSRPPMDVP